MADQSAQDVRDSVDEFKAYVTSQFRNAVRRVIADRIEDDAVDLASLSDHTLRELAKLGHPYSTRFGKNSFVHLDFEIHKQMPTLSGQPDGGEALTDAFVGELTGGSSRIEYTLRNTARHWPFLRDGTRVMRQRPLHQELADIVTEELFPQLVENLTDSFRRFQARKARRKS